LKTPVAEGAYQLRGHAWIWECLGTRARPDAKWLSSVLDCEATTVNKVFREIFTEKEEIKNEREICDRLKSTGRTYYAQFPAPLELYAFVRLLKPKFVVESGVSSGVSSAHMLMGLRHNRVGTLYSIDLPATQKSTKRERGTASWALPFGKSSGWAIPGHLKRRWRLSEGRSENVMPELLGALDRVDLFCHDSPHTAEHLAFELRRIKEHLGPGSVVVADNTDMNPAAFKRTADELGASVLYRGHSSSLAAFRVPL
jgi:Methyltransferase domain